MRSWSVLAILFSLAFTPVVWASNPKSINSATLVEAERMARAGNVVAQTYLGLVHDIGDGVPQNPSTAARWYRMAADRGSADAQMFLGSAYLAGRGVHRDLTDALHWLNLAAKTLTGEDKTICEGLLDEAVWDASPDQLATGLRRAAEWQPKSVDPRPVERLSTRSLARRLRYQATLTN